MGYGIEASSLAETPKNFLYESTWCKKKESANTLKPEALKVGRFKVDINWETDEKWKVANNGKRSEK